MSKAKETPALSGPPPGAFQRYGAEHVLAGVCAGLGGGNTALTMILRVGFLLGALVFGLGALVYTVLWVMMKRDPVPEASVPPLFRRVDWVTAGVTTLIVLAGYLYTLAPDLTLEDSGELAVGSFYLGVPHPPGYPIWTIYTWLFTVLLPFANIAWRVAVSSAVAGAFSCGLVALLASRGSSMILESIEELKNIDRRWESALCVSAGYVAGMLIGFNGFMWSQAVIVEVYTLSVLSLLGVLTLLLRWIYAPHQRRYLYWTLLLFGVCFTNHQTLILAAMGIEVAIAVADRRLGRDLLLLNSVLFLFGLFLKSKGLVTAFDANLPLFRIYLAIGLASLAGYAWLALSTQRVAEQRTIFTGLCMGKVWMVGAGLYFLMPVLSMTNPPMNWGYPRTWEGFLHALTRGQYERANPTSDLGRFVEQMFMLLEGAVDEFNLVYLLIAVVPFLFFRRLQTRERAWLLGLVAMYFCLSVLLISLMNPTPDRQSRELHRVFFTASHVMIALCGAYGLAIFGGLMATRYGDYRRLGLIASAVASAFAFYSVTVTFQSDRESMFSQMAFLGAEPSVDPLIRFTALFSLGVAVAAVAVFIFARTRAPLMALVTLMFVLPLESVFSHWSDNEQRGHLFGYWFGHDMFTPPFGLYPEMGRDAVLFGGTDPGRFCPTYMIFCESFIPPRCKPLDPKYDRRDVYIITQNALADQTYLNYIRAHYNRSTQKDPPFLQGMVEALQEMAMDKVQRDRRRQLQPHTTNGLARAVGALQHVARPLDRMLTGFGARVEARRRAEGVYPPAEIHTPSPEDHGRCMSDYFEDASKRLQQGQLRAGEDVRVSPDGRLQVAGQVAVMAINGLLTKVIFDQNPTNEFYVEESFPLEWMYPHLEPFGIIMKISREPLAEMTEESVRRDHEFWSRYSDRLVGNWITYETPVKDICDFAVRVYERKDYTGFKGDRKFIRDDQAQKAFSKLRSSIGGVYSWRVANAKNPVEQARMLKEAEFAFKQAFAYCPYSPEAVYRFTSLLMGAGRLEDAERLVQTCLRFDRDNENIQAYLNQIRTMRQGGMPPAGAPVAQAHQRVQQLQAQLATNPGDAPATFELASLMVQTRQTSAALGLFDRLLSQPGLEPSVVVSIANAFAQLRDGPRLERALQRLVVVSPESPEAWYDLASTQAILGRNPEALTNLAKALELSRQRVQKDPKQRDLREDATTNQGFSQLRSTPEFQRLIAPQ